MNTPVKSSRQAAISILSDILESGAYANIALRKALPQTGLDSRDRAFVTELVNETLRNLLSIDHVLNHFSKVPVAKMKPFIRNLLRISVCQLRHIAKTPESAAVNEAVILAKANGYAGLSGYVNGVLRTIVRQPDTPPMPSPGGPEYLARRYSYPRRLAASLVKWLGAEEAEIFCQNSHLPPPVTIFVNTHKTTPEALAEALRDEGVECLPLDAYRQPEAIVSPLLDMHHPNVESAPPPDVHHSNTANSPLGSFLVIRNTGDISKLNAFLQGHFIVMDPGAVFAVTAMGLTPGQTVIDLCAAPGGKSVVAACHMGNTGRVHACDIHPHRTGLIKETVKRLGLTCITPKTADATIYDPALDSTADAVLLDVPCSGFGTIRKRSEIKYNRTAADIISLAEKQRQMLSIAAKYVKPGGILVYSTCTVTREENINNIHWFLQRHSFKVQPFPGPNPEEMRFIEEDGCIQILPGPFNDGFFIAAMKKNL
ncbi:MAG: 16S rRNA (cytosine(967)-C(5))-methyltransferase RsmB [Defluviitaleaceae bacterium]|nr:16S rRNA (cytosine(967)-C(5))-methyltransferase RsmB [Defluviitaleaceae bacterium]